MTEGNGYIFTGTADDRTLHLHCKPTGVKGQIVPVLPWDQSQHGSQGQLCQGLDEAGAIREWKEGWSLLCLEQMAVP